MELARAQYERWNAQDFEAWIGGFDPDVEYFSSISAGLDGTGRYYGHAGMRRFLEDYLVDWERFQLEPVEYIDCGAQVVACTRAMGRGRGSGLEVERDVAHVWTFQAGRAIRHLSYASRTEALKAVGLEDG